MKKVGFICEGQTEYILLKSEGFKNYLLSLDVEIAFDIIDAKGCKNLLPHNLEPSIRKLKEYGAESIIILTDLDDDECITITKSRIDSQNDYLVIIAVKEIEAWFLANTTSMRLILNDPNFIFEFPELETNPFKTIYDLLVAKKKGSYNKRRVVKSLLDLGFSVQDSASHPNCPSAKYFINQLTALSVN